VTAYSQWVLLYNFLEGVDNDFPSAGQATSREVLLLLFRLFAYNTMNNEQREFRRAAGLSDEQLDSLDDRVLSLMDAIRPHAVRLVDAWSIPDFVLDRYVVIQRLRAFVV
jgi:acyl-CoA oxidase